MAPLTETGIEVVFTPESIDDDIRREGVLCMIEVRSRVNRRNATLGARGGPGVDAEKAGVCASTDSIPGVGRCAAPQTIFHSA